MRSYTECDLSAPSCRLAFYLLKTRLTLLTIHRTSFFTCSLAQEAIHERHEAEPEEPPASALTKHAYRIGLSATETKAGLETVDKAQVNKVIYEMSKNSRYFQNERRKEAEIERRVEHMKKQLATVRDVEALGATVDLMVSRFEQQRDLSQTILHVDMDAFFGACTRGMPECLVRVSMFANYC